MDEQYYQLFNVEQLDNASKLAIPRALGLYEACMRNRDFDVVQLLRHEKKDFEYIVIDVQCDGVPPNNSVGIRYYERLVLCMSADPSVLPETLALRKDFPSLMHENRIAPNVPVSLCLYFESTASVRRTWTPENFLRRVQWWLEKSARDELHPADQPVEQLFFVAQYELVLPWNFKELKKNPANKFVINRGPTRQNAAETFFLQTAGQEDSTRSITPVEITLSPITHGRIELEPHNLGELVDTLNLRGTELLPVLENVIQNRVDTQGIPISSDESASIILLHVPMSRTSDGPPEKFVTRGFVILTGMLGIGQKLGVLLTHEGKYFRDVRLFGQQTANADAWRSEVIYPMELSRQLDAAAARFQSGIYDEGPDGVIVGVGSLGSMMLELWGRSGWGKWSAVDKDHIKPHNIARHVAHSQHIGMLKAEVVAQLHAAVTDGASKVVPISSDATDLNDDIVGALRASKLVIDASTTLEYPRLSSTRDDFPRHVSVFVTPDGNAAVLLAEDVDRKVRLRTLEAQYYRAVIHEAWGAHHLDGNLGTFWSGASCRDISTVLPYSRVVVHAATLAEQVRLTTSRQDPDIAIWLRNPVSGEIRSVAVPVHTERRCGFGNLDLFIDEGVVQKLNAERANSFPTETGGILLGFYDFNINAVVVIDALPAPADSKSTGVSFERGVEGLRGAVADAARRTAGVVQYIGEWHSHPPNYPADPSRDDIFQLIYLSLKMAEDGLPAVSLIVGENGIRVMQGRA